ncbi:hypothetical protein BHE74_00016152 [Ensete ventricosum]|nr:hypothetical protein BHE74_00016152 [Ensete ventricosum]RZS08363.1 hypothetical protein BHM03_00039325 [Ensete ventricosum]
MWILAYKKAIARLYNQRGKLAPNWEGPYRVVNIAQDDIYTLTMMVGKLLPRMWHTSNVKKFYIQGIRLGRSGDRTKIRTEHKCTIKNTV